MSKIICLVNSDHQFEDIVTKKYSIRFIYVETENDLIDNILFIGSNKACSVIKAMRYINEHVEYDYIMVVRDDVKKLDLTQLDKCCSIWNLDTYGIYSSEERGKSCDHVPKSICFIRSLEDLRRLKENNDCCFAIKPYENETYYIVSKLELKVHLHRKYILKHGELIENILQKVIVPIENKPNREIEFNNDQSIVSKPNMV